MTKLNFIKRCVVTVAAFEILVALLYVGGPLGVCMAIIATIGAMFTVMGANLSE